MHLFDAALNHLQEPVVGGLQNGTFELTALAAETINHAVFAFHAKAAVLEHVVGRRLDLLQCA